MARAGGALGVPPRTYRLWERCAAMPESCDRLARLARERVQARPTIGAPTGIPEKRPEIATGARDVVIGKLIQTHLPDDNGP